MKTSLVKITAYLMLTMSILPTTVQAREREFLALQQLQERKLEEARIRELEKMSTNRAAEADKENQKSVPCASRH